MNTPWPELAPLLMSIPELLASVLLALTDPSMLPIGRFEDILDELEQRYLFEDHRPSALDPQHPSLQSRLWDDDGCPF